MRIHGSKILQRRTDIKAKKNYQRYRPELQEDFCHICGYCGKHELVSHDGMRIDHFVPQSVDPGRITDYQNLVYACFRCNSKKYEHWPTNDKNIPNNGNAGFVDPTDVTYDTHLGRGVDGSIEYYTEVGKFMFEKAFRFDIRPTAQIWKASQMYELLDALDKNLEKKPKSERDRYIKVSLEFRQLNKFLFEWKE